STLHPDVCFTLDAPLQQKDANTSHLPWLKLHLTECLPVI
ncbi:uncharacterized protein METZ01_LOCUS239960, partial [marine metagenome]